MAGAALWVGVPLAITLLCWRALPIKPKSGPGPSFEGALHMALHYGITFGNHLIFTYGPLGFLSIPTLWYSATGIIAVLYAVLLRFALALALFAAARRTYGTVVGAIVALIVVDASEFARETVPFLVFCVWMLERVSGSRQRLALMAIGGAVAGLELLNKISIGIEITAMALVVALATRGRRPHQVVVTLAGLVAALLVGWTVTGQDWGALAAYARTGAQIVSGYAGALSTEDTGLRWETSPGSWRSPSASSAPCR